MSNTTPTTIVFGPTRAYNTVSPNSRIRMQLHGLQPGDFWSPAHEAQLLAPHDLVLYVPNQIWTVVDLPFFFRFDQNYNFQRNRIFVNASFGPSLVFLLHIPHLVDTWVRNELTSPAGNYAFGGSATFSFFEAP